MSESAGSDPQWVSWADCPGLLPFLLPRCLLRPQLTSHRSNNPDWDSFRQSENERILILYVFIERFKKQIYSRQRQKQLLSLSWDGWSWYSCFCPGFIFTSFDCIFWSIPSLNLSSKLHFRRCWFWSWWMVSLLRLLLSSSSVARISTCFRWEWINITDHRKLCISGRDENGLELGSLDDNNGDVNDGGEWSFQVYLFQWREFGLSLASQQVSADLNEQSCHHHNHTYHNHNQTYHITDI